MSRITTSRRRNIRRGALGAALAIGVVLGAPTVASAHVGVSPDAISPGESAVLTFSFTHGCDGSPTTALRITMPEGLASVSPTVDTTWNIAVERGENGLVTAVTYAATTPIASDLRGAASMAIRLSEDAPESLAFPVEQQCESGVNQWVELATEGEDPHDLESPAPVVQVIDGSAAASGAGSEGHGSDANTDAGTDAGDGAEGTAAADGARPSEPVVGTALGVAGLITALAALVLSVLAYRRRA